MLYLFITLCLLVNLHKIVPVQSDDSCPTDSFTSLNGCLKTSVQKIMSMTVNEDLKNEAYKCFQDNGCQAPTDGNNIFGSGNSSVYGDNNADKVASCFMQTADSASTAIEGCVRENGFSNFASLHASDLKEVNFKQSFAKEYFKIMDALRGCPKQSQSKVGKCLMKLMPKMKGVFESLKNFCESTQTCVNNFESNTCDFETVRKQLCTCAKGELKIGSNTLDRYEDSFFSCLNQPTPDRTSLIPFVRKIVDLICVGDPCQAVAHFESQNKKNAASSNTNQNHGGAESHNNNKPVNHENGNDSQDSQHHAAVNSS